MAPSPVPEPSSRTPVWFRSIHVLDKAALVASVLAAAVELVRVLGNGPNIGGAVALGVTVAGIVASRYRARLGLALVAGGSVTAALMSWDPIVPWTIVVFTLFSVTVRGMGALRAGVITGIVVYASVLYADRVGVSDPTALIALTTSLASAASGTALRAHRNYWLALEQRAADAIATRQIEVNRRVAEERVRIARDLHDVVGHEVALIGMHLGVAEVNLPPEASPARAALESARASVRHVLHETQLILDVLRRGGGEDDPAHPAPDIARIPALIESFRGAGVAVNAAIDEDLGALDPAVGLAAFRIVQEALTNAQRHGLGPVELRIHCADGYLTIVAANDRAATRGAGEAGRGYGLVGMRERALSAGGRLVVDGDDRRYRVTVTLRTDGGMIR